MASSLVAVAALEAGGVVNRAADRAVEAVGVARHRAEALVPLHALEPAHRVEDRREAETGLLAAGLLAHPLIEDHEVQAPDDDAGRAQGDEDPPDLLLGRLE